MLFYFYIYTQYIYIHMYIYTHILSCFTATSTCFPALSTVLLPAPLSFFPYLRPSPAYFSPNTHTNTHSFTLISAHRENTKVRDCKELWEKRTRKQSVSLIKLANSNSGCCWKCVEKLDCDIRLQLNPSACLCCSLLAEPGEEREERKV